MQMPPYAYVQQLAPPPPMPPDERARRIAALANGKLIAKLAPLVDRLAGRSDAGPVLHAPPAPGWVPLRLDARKVLAFDGESTTPLVLAAIVALFLGFNAVGCFVTFATKGKWGWLVGGVAASIFTISIVVMCALSVPARIRVLRAVLARSVVVPARISFGTPNVSIKGQEMGINATVDYGYGGAWCRAVKNVDGEVYALLGPTPEILVDTTSPDRILFRDLVV